MAIASHVPVIASGGIGCMEDLISLIPLEEFGVTGVIVGRALYDEKIDLQEALVVMKNKNLQDTYSSENFHA